MKKIILSVLLFCLMIFTLNESKAQLFTGGNGRGDIMATLDDQKLGNNFTTDGSWQTTTNWSAGVLPGSDETVYIMANATLDNTITIDGLIISSGKTLTITNTGELTVNNNLENNAGNGGLIFQSDNSGTGSLITHSTGVNATFKRYIAAAEWGTWDDGWHNLSSPVAGQAIYPEFVHGYQLGTEDFYKWDEANNQWISIKNEDGTGWNSNFTETDFAVGTGYLVAYENDVTKNFAGTLNVSDVSISNLGISSGDNRSWHLLGNPYSSALTWYSSWTASNIAGTAKIWNEANKSYSDRSSGTVIPATNGFMVQVSGGTGSLTIPKANRTHSTQQFFKSDGDFDLMLTARNLDHPSAQECVIKTHPQAGENFDLEFDSEFLAGFAPVFYAVADNEKLSTNCLPEINYETAIPLTFIKNEGTSFRIEATGIENLPYGAMLLDKQTGVNHNLSSNPEYNFTASNGDAPDRFLLHFGSVGIQEATIDKQIRVFAENGIITVANNSSTPIKQILISDVSGRQLYTGRGSIETQFSFNFRASTGMYMITFITEKETISKKIFIK